jgi:2-methylcitrate dehydratase PrpD
VTTDGPLLEQLGAFAARVRAEGVPGDVAASVRQRILDIVGLQVAAVPLSTSQATLSFVAEQGGTPHAHVVGCADRVPAAWAAFANGVLAHSLDYDDTHLPSIVHPSASVIPAALAAGEMVGASGADVIVAVAVGLEVTVRLGMAGFDRASNNSVFFEHGQHATSICGTVGAAAAVAVLLGGDDVDIRHAMAVSCSMASGILEANRTGGTVKRLHCGWAAHAGVTAAQMVAKGITGPPTALEGRFGFFEVFLHGVVDLSEISEGLGERWSVPRISFKPYPANHFTHAGIDAARRLRARGLHPDAVRSATLRVCSATVRTIGEPLELKQQPETGYQAQFSGPYTVAAALIGGGGLGLNLDDFTDELARDPRRRELMSRITVVADEECDEIYPYQFPAILEVQTNDGEDLVERVLANRGSPEDPLSEDELATKFIENATRGLPDDRVQAIRDCAASFGDAADVSSLLALTAKEGPAGPHGPGRSTAQRRSADPARTFRPGGWQPF